jgi:hypothetical protein
MRDKKTHLKEMILNYLFGLLQADTENNYKDDIIELAKKIHEL